MIVIEVVHNGQKLKSYKLPLGNHELGNNDHALSLRYPTVSKRHGVVGITEAHVTYTDLRSRNGSYIGHEKKPALAETPVNWKKGEPLFIGPFSLKWHRDQTTDHKQNEQAIRGELADLYAKFLAEDPLQAHEKLLIHAERLEHDRRTHVLESIHYEFHGDGPLRGCLSDSRCREIIINGFDEIYVDTGAGLEKLSQTFVSPQTYEAWAVRTAHHAGRRLDLQHPVCEATLANGARFHAVMSPVSARGLSVAIRRFGSAPLEEGQALESGWVDDNSLAIMKAAVDQKLNIVISGGTSTGKTSLLNFLCRYLPRNERILTVEDTVELAPPVENLVQLQARKSNADGVGEISLRQLVQCALRMRPDRIIVGECRGSEVIEMLQALNTGHPGSLTTVHSNSTEEALHRLELLALLGATNLSIECIREWIRTTIDLIVQVERDSIGHRHVSEISRRRDRSFEIIYKRPCADQMASPAS